MKKIYLPILFILIFSLSNSITLSKASESSILFDGINWDISNKTICDYGVTYVEATSLLPQFNYTYYIGNTFLQAETDGRKLIFHNNNKDYKDNDSYKIMERAVLKRNDRIYLPLRFFAELNGYRVDWNSLTSQITISSPAIHNEANTKSPNEENDSTSSSQQGVSQSTHDESTLTNKNVNETESLNKPEPTPTDMTLPSNTDNTTPPFNQGLTSEEMPVIPKLFTSINGIYYLNTIEQDIRVATEYYKDITHLEVIGRTLDNRPLYAIRVGEKSSYPKPSVLLISNIHAREDFTSMLTMKMMDNILYSYYGSGNFGNYNVKDMLSKIDIWFVPVINPDGLAISQYGFYASNNYANLYKMNNIAKDYRWWKANANGVDLNKNFDDGNWYIKSSYPNKSSENYKGPFPNSELETVAIQRFCNEKLPLMSISYHTSGNIMYWADNSTHAGFDGIDISIINRMASLTGYRPMPVSTTPSEYGSGFENWFKARFNRFSICMELSPPVGKPYIQHNDNLFESLVWNRAKYSGLQLAVEALNYQPKMYEVYQSGNYLKSFYSKERAKAYAQYYANSYILNNGVIIP